MKKYAIGLALLAVMGAASAVSPALAQGRGAPVNCDDPNNANNPICLAQKPGGPGHHQPPANGNNPPANNPPANNPPPNNPPANNNNNNNGGFNNNNNNNGFNGNNRFDGNNDHRRPGFPGGPGDFGGPGQHHDRGQEEQFRQLFNGFSAGMFARPFFDVRPGVIVPHSYRLRPVPYEIYRDYPEYRGFLFFIDRDGSIVIVSPRSYRIVDIL